MSAIVGVGHAVDTNQLVVTGFNENRIRLRVIENFGAVDELT